MKGRKGHWCREHLIDQSPPYAMYLMNVMGQPRIIMLYEKNVCITDVLKAQMGRTRQYCKQVKSLTKKPMVGNPPLYVKRYIYMRGSAL